MLRRWLAVPGALVGTLLGLAGALGQVLTLLGCQYPGWGVLMRFTYVRPSLILARPFRARPFRYTNPEGSLKH